MQTRNKRKIVPGIGLVLLAACGVAVGFPRGTIRYASRNSDSPLLNPVYAGSPVYGGSPAGGGAYGSIRPRTAGPPQSTNFNISRSGGYHAAPSLFSSGIPGEPAMPRSSYTPNAPAYPRSIQSLGPSYRMPTNIPIIPTEEQLHWANKDAPANPNNPMDLLRQMSDFLGKLNRFQLGTQDTVDEILDSGEKVQLSSWRSFHVSRPDKLVTDVQGDVASKRLWFDGKTGVLLDREKTVFGTFPFSGTIDGLMDEAVYRYKITVPFIDLLYSDLYRAVYPSILTGTYVGRHKAEEFDCHHLAFTQANCDWEIWIQADGPPLPRKFVITYKERPGKPRFSARLPYWDINPEFKPGLFTPQIPPGTTRVDMLPVTTLEDRQKAGEKRLAPDHQ